MTQAQFKGFRQIFILPSFLILSIFQLMDLIRCFMISEVVWYAVSKDFNLSYMLLKLSVVNCIFCG